MLQALTVKVLLKVSFSSTRNVTWPPSTVICQHLTHPFCPSLMPLTPIGRLHVGSLDNKLVCFSFIIPIDMNYKNENGNYGLTTRDVSFPFLNG